MVKRKCKRVLTGKKTKDKNEDSNDSTDEPAYKKVAASSTSLLEDDLALPFNVEGADIASSQKMAGEVGFSSHFWCNYCEYSSDTKKELVTHMRQHMSKCSYCAFSSLSRAEIAKHVKVEHMDEAEKTICEVDSSSTMGEHDMDKDPCSACIFCDFMTYSTEHLEKHTSLKHQGMLPKSVAKMISKQNSAKIRRADALFYGVISSSDTDKSMDIGQKNSPEDKAVVIESDKADTDRDVKPVISQQTNQKAKTSNWEVKVETLYCLSCPYSNVAIEKLKCHALVQHPQSAAAASFNSEASCRFQDMTFYCVRETCRYSTVQYSDYEDHLLKCSTPKETLLFGEKERLEATVEFIIKCLKKQGVSGSQPFIDFCSDLDIKYRCDSATKPEVNLCEGMTSSSNKGSNKNSNLSSANSTISSDLNNVPPHSSFQNISSGTTMNTINPEVQNVSQNSHTSVQPALSSNVSRSSSVDITNQSRLEANVNQQHASLHSNTGNNASQFTPHRDSSHDSNRLSIQDASPSFNSVYAISGQSSPSVSTQPGNQQQIENPPYCSQPVAASASDLAAQPIDTEISYTDDQPGMMDLNETPSFLPDADLSVQIWPGMEAQNTSMTTQPHSLPPTQQSLCTPPLPHDVQALENGPYSAPQKPATFDAQIGANAQSYNQPFEDFQSSHNRQHNLNQQQPLISMSSPHPPNFQSNDSLAFQNSQGSSDLSKDNNLLYNNDNENNTASVPNFLVPSSTERSVSNTHETNSFLTQSSQSFLPSGEAITSNPHPSPGGSIMNAGAIPPNLDGSPFSQSMPPNSMQPHARQRLFPPNPADQLAAANPPQSIDDDVIVTAVIQGPIPQNQMPMNPRGRGMVYTPRGSVGHPRGMVPSPRGMPMPRGRGMPRGGGNPVPRGGGMPLRGRGGMPMPRGRGGMMPMPRGRGGMMPLQRGRGGGGMAPMPRGRGGMPLQRGRGGMPVQQRGRGGNPAHHARAHDVSGHFVDLACGVNEDSKDDEIQIVSVTPPRAGKQIPKAVDAKKFSYCCIHCGQDQGSKDVMKSHMKSCHSESLLGALRNVETGQWLYFCPQIHCQFMTYDENRLTEHLFACYNIDKNKPLPFDMQSALKNLKSLKIRQVGASNQNHPNTGGQGLRDAFNNNLQNAFDDMVENTFGRQTMPRPVNPSHARQPVPQPAPYGQHRGALRGPYAPRGRNMRQMAPGRGNMPPGRGNMPPAYRQRGPAMSGNPRQPPSPYAPVRGRSRGPRLPLPPRGMAPMRGVPPMRGQHPPAYAPRPLLAGMPGNEQTPICIDLDVDSPSQPPSTEPEAPQDAVLGADIAAPSIGLPSPHLGSTSSPFTSFDSMTNSSRDVNSINPQPVAGLEDYSGVPPNESTGEETIAESSNISPSSIPHTIAEASTVNAAVPQSQRNEGQSLPVLDNTLPSSIAGHDGTSTPATMSTDKNSSASLDGTRTSTNAIPDPAQLLEQIKALNKSFQPRDQSTNSSNDQNTEARTMPDPPQQSNPDYLPQTDGDDDEELVNKILLEKVFAKVPHMPKKLSQRLVLKFKKYALDRGVIITPTSKVIDEFVSKISYKGSHTAPSSTPSSAPVGPDKVNSEGTTLPINHTVPTTSVSHHNTPATPVPSSAIPAVQSTSSSVIEEKTVLPPEANNSAQSTILNNASTGSSESGSPLPPTPLSGTSVHRFTSGVDETSAPSSAPAMDSTEVSAALNIVSSVLNLNEQHTSFPGSPPKGATMPVCESANQPASVPSQPVYSPKDSHLPSEHQTSPFPSDQTTTLSSMPDGQFQDNSFSSTTQPQPLTNAMEKDGREDDVIETKIIFAERKLKFSGPFADIIKKSNSRMGKDFEDNSPVTGDDSGTPAITCPTPSPNKPQEETNISDKGGDADTFDKEQMSPSISKELVSSANQYVCGYANLEVDIAGEPLPVSDFSDKSAMATDRSGLDSVSKNITSTIDCSSGTLKFKIRKGSAPRSVHSASKDENSNSSEKSEEGIQLAEDQLVRRSERKRKVMATGYGSDEISEMDELMSDEDEEYHADSDPSYDGSDDEWGKKKKKSKPPPDPTAYDVSIKGSYRCWMCKKVFSCVLSVKRHITQKHKEGFGLCTIRLTETGIPEPNEFSLLVFCSGHCKYVTGDSEAYEQHLEKCKKQPIVIDGVNYKTVQQAFFANEFGSLIQDIASGAISTQIPPKTKTSSAPKKKICPDPAPAQQMSFFDDLSETHSSFFNPNIVTTTAEVHPPPRLMLDEESVGIDSLPFQ